MSIIKFKPFLFKGKVYTNGESPIFIRITKDRKNTYVPVSNSFKYTALAAQWNAQECKLYNSKPTITKKDRETRTKTELKALQTEYNLISVHPNHNKINSEITKRLGEIAEIIELHKKKPLKLEALKKILSSEVTNTDSFIEFAKVQVNKKLQAEDIRTYKRYNTVINKLCEFLNGKDLVFGDLTPEFLESYEVHLKTKLKNKTNTVYTNLKTIRAILYQAIKESKFDQGKNPFFIFKLKEDRNTVKEKLTFEEVQKIKNLKLAEGSPLFNARNIFLFSFYNFGIRIGDSLQLKWSDIKNGRLRYKMDKQDSLKDIKLNSESLAIIEYYKKHKKSIYIFNYLTDSDSKLNKLSFFNLVSSKTSTINLKLKDIADLCNIDKKLTTHIARHSFASIAKKKGINSFEIQEALSHSSLKQTETYLKSLDSEIQDNTFDSVFKDL